MTRLTTAEKEHWKSRIENRINKAIDSVEAKDPDFMRSTRAKAQAAANKALGITPIQSKISSLKNQQKAIDKEVEELELSMFVKVLGEEEVIDCPTYRLKAKIDDKVTRLQVQFLEQFLADSPIGRELVKLQKEKDSLLDTVWLATSGAQIRDLWNRVAVIFGDETTPLQQQILDSQV